MGPFQIFRSNDSGIYVSKTRAFDNVEKYSAPVEIACLTIAVFSLFMIWNDNYLLILGLFLIFYAILSQFTGKILSTTILPTPKETLPVFFFVILLSRKITSSTFLTILPPSLDKKSL